MVFMRNLKFIVGIHNTTSEHGKGNTPITEERVESLLCAIADVVKKHTSHDAFVEAKYDKVMGIKVNS